MTVDSSPDPAPGNNVKYRGTGELHKNWLREQPSPTRSEYV
jgi:hypothetical protein